ncbi:hypothetical protein QNA24_22260 [Rhodococcus qingshengii]|uniref:hypothetical protein n=1 Tax=Rhodococcus qingshengii TaxID=334542 RepID=UPI0024B8E5A2|nr:hypothetical protein [Rhodococcus qingshengii]MDJ0489104.1 hypothetical protein [Rhodococcus qingshengii]
MASRKHFKALERRLTQAGYRYDRTTGGGDQMVFTHPDRPEISIKPDIAEGPMLKLSKRLDAEFKARSVAKRNPDAVRERQAAERERLKMESDRLDSERALIVAYKESLPAGDFSLLTRNEIHDLEQQIERIDKDRRRIERLMTEIPVHASQVGRAKHRAGRAWA